MPNDYSLRFPTPTIAAPDFASGIDKITAALMARQERQRQLAKDAEYARQNDLNESREARHASREQQIHELALSDRNRKLAGDTGAMIAQGRMGEADAALAASQFVDPKTGMATTPKLDRGDPGQKATYTEDFSGMMKALPMWGGAHEAIASQPGAENFGKPQQLTEERAARNPSLTLPGGERVEFDPGERQKFEQEKADRSRAGIMALLAPGNTLSPQARQTLEIQAGLVGAQAPGVTNAAVTGAEAQRRTQDFTGEQNQLNRDNAVRLRAMKGVGSGKASAASERGDKRVNLAEETAARSLAKDVLSNFGFREIQAGNRKFNDMAATVTTTPNAALDAVTSGSFVKMAQGGTGVISDSDMRQFWGRIGGVGEKSAQWIENVLSGQISPDKREKVAEAVRWLGAQAGKNLSDIKGAMTYAFEKSPNLSKYGPQMTGTYFSDAREAKPGGGGGGGATGGATTARQQEMIKWANANPNDKRAAAILKKFGQ